MLTESEDKLAIAESDSDKILLQSLFFDNIRLPQAADKIKQLSKSTQFSYVVTPNVDHLARISGKQADKDLQLIYQEAALSLCDSRIIDKLLRLKGKTIKEVIPGSTLTEYLFKQVLTADDKVLVVGVEHRFIEVLRKTYPELNILHINPSMGFINKPDEVADLIGQIESLQPNYTFLSVGSPRQEVLAAKIKHVGSVTGIGLCVGASVLFLVNAEKRAPAILQTLHLEWLYRMLQNPKRLAIRYLKNFLALPSIFKSL